MIEKIQLIKFNTNKNLILKIYSEWCNINFDSIAEIILSSEDDEIVIVRDILGFILKQIKIHFANINKYVLDDIFIDIDLGIAQNEYYHCISEDLEIKNEEYLKEINGEWIGSKYCVFESKKYSLWLYILDNKNIITVTPNYLGHFTDDKLEYYYNFKDNYSVIYKFEVDKEELERCILKCDDIPVEIFV